eukprot:4222454-Amphidinium_carterae.1
MQAKSTEAKLRDRPTSVRSRPFMWMQTMFHGTCWMECGQHPILVWQCFGGFEVVACVQRHICRCCRTIASTRSSRDMERFRKV